MKKFIFYFAMACLLCISFMSCSEDFIEIPNNTTTAKQANDFSVSIKDVCTYLSKDKKKITRAKDIMDIEPICHKDDTVMYKVMFEKGWKLISADKRYPAVLAYNDSTESTSEFYDWYINNIGEDIYYTKRSSGLADTISTDWRIAGMDATSLMASRGREDPSEPGESEGEWILYNIISEDTTYNKPHLMNTHWDQSQTDNTSPIYNKYTPMEGPSHCLVGCTNVAGGQILLYLHQYWNYSPATIDSVYFDSVQNKPIFYGYSNSIWSGMDNNDEESIAMFLSYIGQRGQTTYSRFGSSAPFLYFKNGPMNDYGITCTTDNSWDESHVNSSIYANIPVFVEIFEDNANPGHAIVIDGVRHEHSDVTELYIYVTDPEQYFQEDNPLYDVDSLEPPTGYLYEIRSYSNDYYYYQINAGSGIEDNTYYRFGNSINIQLRHRYKHVDNVHYDFRRM